MKSKTAKILQKFAEVEGINYNHVKAYFLTRSKRFQKLDIENFKKIIAQKGGEKMAKQMTCDRSKQVIAPGEDYMPLLIKQPEGGTKEIDLCMNCWNDFQAFMNINPGYGSTGGMSISQPQPANPTPAPAAPAAPAQPAAPAAPAEPNPNTQAQPQQ